MKIMVIFCAYSLIRLKDNQDKLNELFSLLSNSEFIDVYIVDNLKNDHIKQILTGFTAGRNNIFLIDGSNNFAEFSAWLEAIEHADSANKKYNSYILLNDTIYSHFGFYFERLIRLLYLSATFDSNIPKAGGTIQIFNKSKVFDIEYDKFICTAVFVFNHQAKQIFKEICFKSFDSWQGNNLQLGAQELINNYFKGEQSGLLYTHLFGGGWYNSKPFEQFDKELLRLKFTAIVCEHYFSAKLAHMNGYIYNLDEIGSLKALRGIKENFGFNFTLMILIKFISIKILNYVKFK